MKTSLDYLSFPFTLILHTGPLNYMTENLFFIEKHGWERQRQQHQPFQRNKQGLLGNEVLIYKINANSLMKCF